MKYTLLFFLFFFIIVISGDLYSIKICGELKTGINLTGISKKKYIERYNLNRFESSDAYFLGEMGINFKNKITFSLVSGRLDRGTEYRSIDSLTDSITGITFVPVLVKMNFHLSSAKIPINLFLNASGGIIFKNSDNHLRVKSLPDSTDYINEIPSQNYFKKVYTSMWLGFQLSRTLRKFSAIFISYEQAFVFANPIITFPVFGIGLKMFLKIKKNGK